MRRRIERSNPFYRIPRFAFGFELIPEGVRLLDYGCHDGAFGAELTRQRKVEYVGVDRNRDAVARAPEGVHVSHVTNTLPFADGYFDVATMFEVLEHLYDQDRVLREVHRVLRPAGLLIVSVPRQHALSWLDLANLKFRFRGLHRTYYTLTHSGAAYRARYVENLDGLVGDVEKEKAWHQHFRESEMRTLLGRNGFRIAEMDGAGLFSSAFDFLATVFRLGFLFPQSLRNSDDYTFHYRMLFCAARKVGAER